VTEVQQAPPAANWYPDPQNPQLVRWWDGQAWTANTADRPRPEAPKPGPENTYVPFARNWAAEQAAVTLAIRRRHTQTVSIWLLATTPLWFGSINFLVGWLLWQLNPWGAGIGTLCIEIAILIVLVSRDRTQLQIAGHEKVAPIILILLCPLAFFIVRAVRVGRGGLAPLFTYVGIVIAITAIAVLIALPFLILAANSAGHYSVA
jgi:Protein of unknown function (DUF2510)